MSTLSTTDSLQARLDDAWGCRRRVAPVLWPKQQQGSYAQLFNIPLNSQNQRFVQNPQLQTPCLGTTVVVYGLVEGRIGGARPQ